MVIDAAHDRVVLHLKGGVIHFREPVETWEDEHVVVRYDGYGFGVFHKRNGQRWGSGTYTSITQAKHEYLSTLPKKAVA